MPPARRFLATTTGLSEAGTILSGSTVWIGNNRATCRFQPKVGQIEVGSFLAELVNFLIVALALWIFLVKFLGFLMRSKEREKPAPGPTRDQQLLEEIRDLPKAGHG
ncbi:MAG: MscL family protein [Planctomycetes bacterium]|nr:MscL family protein [Planctomycetota bacterium]